MKLKPKWQQIESEWKRIRVTDARAHLSVRVQPEDIAGSICSDHQNCVIARAIMRRHSAARVDVGANVVLIGKDKNHAKRYRLAPVAQDQVRYFDEHKGVFAPCKPLLSPPPARPAGTNVGKRYNKTGEHKNKNRVDKRTPTR